MPRSTVWLGVFMGFVAAGCGGSGGSGSGSTAAPISSGAAATTSGTTSTPPPTTPPPAPVAARPLPSGAVGGPRAKGIDVSKWQGTIDWAQVKADGIDFAIARTSHGFNDRDATFTRNWVGMKANGIVRGVYHYLLPQQDAVAQADLMVDMINAAGGLEPTDLSPVLDLEDRGGLTAAQVMAKADAFLARVRARTGRYPMIYCSPGFWNPLAAAPHSDNPLWVAHWGVAAPTIPSGWRAWTFWQTSATGRVAGINANVDTDFFNGSVADLKVYAGRAAPAGFFRGLAFNSTGNGYWQVATDGGVFTYGDATFRGTAGGRRHPQPIIGIVRTATGLGYWLFRADGVVIPFGDATHVGDLAGQTVPSPISAMAATRTRRGYWLFHRNGIVRKFGDAQDHGEPTSSGTFVGAAATPTGLGYWMVEHDGDVHAFGDAAPYGDLRGQTLTAPVVALAATITGRGYLLLQADGKVHAFGDAPALTYGGTRRLTADAVSITVNETGRGYWVTDTAGNVLAHGDAAVAPARVSR